MKPTFNMAHILAACVISASISGVIITHGAPIPTKGAPVLTPSTVITGRLITIDTLRDKVYTTQKVELWGENNIIFEAGGMDTNNTIILSPPFKISKYKDN